MHLAALPTNRDVELLSGQLGRLQARVDELNQRLEESGHKDTTPAGYTDGGPASRRGTQT